MNQTNEIISKAKDPETVQWIIDTFGEGVDLNMAEALESGFALSDVIQESSRLHNSLDLMEAFARLAHLLKKRTGVKVRLPNFPANKKLSEVLDAFVHAYEEGLASTQQTAQGAP